MSIPLASISRGRYGLTTLILIGGSRPRLGLHMPDGGGGVVVILDFSLPENAARCLAKAAVGTE